MYKLEFANLDGDALTFFAAKFWLNWIGSGVRRGKLALKTDTEVQDQQTDSSTNSPNTMVTLDDAVVKNEIKERHSNFLLLMKETVKAALTYFNKLWKMRPRLLSVLRKHGTHVIGNLWVSRLRQLNINSRIIVILGTNVLKNAPVACLGGFGGRAGVKRLCPVGIGENSPRRGRRVPRRLTRLRVFRAFLFYFYKTSS